MGVLMLALGFSKLRKSVPIADKRRDRRRLTAQGSLKRPHRIDGMATADTPVRLEVRLPGSRPSFHEVTAAEYLIGSVAGCDLVIPGPDLPPVLGVIARTEDGIRLRRLAPNLKLTVNGKTIHHTPLTNGDAIGIGAAEIRVHVPAQAAMPAAAATKPWSFNIPIGERVAIAERPAEKSGAMRQLQEESERLKQQSREIVSRQNALDEEEQSRRMTWTERETQLEAELETARERRRSVEEAGRHQYTAREVELDQRQRDVDEREHQQAADRTAMEAEIRVHREDLARLDRQRATLEAREQDLSSREKHVEQSLPLIDTKARQLELLEVQMRQDQERIRLGQSELEVARANVNQRMADAERQDTLLRTHEERLERTRIELGKQAQDLINQKMQQDARDRDMFLKQQQLDSRFAELTMREETAKREREQLDQRQQAVDVATTQIHGLREQVIAQANDVKAREQRWAVDRGAVDEAVRVHREDLARLDRFREALENREKQVVGRTAELEQQAQQVLLDMRSLEDKHGQAALAEQRLREEEERVRQLKADLEASTNQLAERSATTEGQQSILVAVKAKLERLREELRVEAQAIADQRGRQETLEQAFVERQHAHEQQSAQLIAANDAFRKARQEFEQQQKQLESSFAQMESDRRKLMADQATLAQQLAEADSRSAEHVEQAGTLRAKASQLLELQQRIETDQKNLADREIALHESDMARQELQAQLLRRADELAAKHQATDELARQIAARVANLDNDRQKVDADLHLTRQDLDVRAAQLKAIGQELQAREENCLRLAERIKEAGKSLAMDRKQRHEMKTRWDEEHRVAAENLVRTRGELQQFKTEVQTQAAAIQQALPELELRGSAALDRLGQAREQLKNHVAELHDYARQSYEDLESLRTQVVSETERLREQQSGLAKARNDHRHTVTAFRQQLIDWQGKISEMKAGAVQNEVRIARKPGDTEAAAREIDAAGAHLARQAAELQQKEAFREQDKNETAYQPTDMRDWFRYRLKELAGTSSMRMTGDGPDILPSGLSNESPKSAKQQSSSDNAAILKMTNDLDPGDKKLGDLLRALDLVDDGTLNTLFMESRRQRRSLRQALLASGKLTVYQMALIEAGNVDGLSIGPLGVIDRLHVTPFESVYRVIDPRSGTLAGPVVLRHLTEAAMIDAAKANEFRERFKTLVELQHPHVAATIEVLDINDRPAALQEWLTGLPAHEWPSLAAVPGAWFRLACQSLLGLAAAHEAGLVHGAIASRSIVLTSEGLVKLTGVGEPLWLSGAKPQAAVADDLIAMGRLATEWAALSPKRKLAKPPRPLPTAVRDILERWTAGGFASAKDVLDALDRAGSQVPAGTETWDRLMKYAGANATDGVAWRKSA